MRARTQFVCRFAGETAIDTGGVSREWFQLVAEALFAPALGLFRSAQTDTMAYTLNPCTARYFHTYETAAKLFSSVQQAYKFAGWFLGRAVLVRAFLRNHACYLDARVFCMPSAAVCLR